MRHGPGQGGLPFHCCVSALLELQTKFREYFTVTKKAPAKPFLVELAFFAFKFKTLLRYYAKRTPKHDK